jgi:hypothetical protein
MTNESHFCSAEFDAEFNRIVGLTWLPWVGEAYAKLPAGRRVLIVGESHYAGWDNPADAENSIKDLESYREFTREVVHESLMLAKWTTRTLSTMHQLFYAPEDRNALWSDLCFYNFVQKAMNYTGDNRQRPAWKDFWDGWGVFLGVVEVLKPDYVLFIGVEAANHFNGFMTECKREHGSVELPEKVGSAYARTARLTVGGTQVPLHFIKHCGSYFSTSHWSDYLHRNARELMASIADSARTCLPDPATRQIHVFGMAKSCLDLRGANAPKLELDLLRLAFAIRDVEETGEQALGYLMVLDEKVETRAKGWLEKYGVVEKVIVRKANIPSAELAALRVEKTQHAIGMLQKYLFDEVERDLSVAELGKKLGENALTLEIEKDHPGISPLHVTLPREALPLQVAWDYYGTLPGQI